MNRETTRSRALLAFLVVLAVVGTIVAVGIFFPVGRDTSVRHVGIFQIISHPVLDAVRDGVKEGLRESGFLAGENLTWSVQNAQGDMNLATTIARGFAQERVDLIVPLGTQATQAAARVTDRIPIVFGAVIDPVGAGVAESIKSPGMNVTGVRDVIPYGEQIDLLLRVAPTVKRIGIVYNPGEANSQYAVDAIRQIAAEKGLKLELAAVSNPSEVLNTARTIAPRIDAFYTAADNTVNAAIESLTKAGSEAHVPVLVSDPGSVEKGGIATIGYDYYELGKQTGRLAARVLQGASPAKTPIEDATSLQYYFNRAAIEQLGLTIPPDLERSAVIY